VVPAILEASGGVVSTSTKPDVLEITARQRSRHGPCFLYDPSGTVKRPAGVEPVHWSPIRACEQWDDALLAARSLVGASRLHTGNRLGSHWSERAEALLAPLLHAAAIRELPLASLLSWVDRREASSALGILESVHADIAADVLSGIATTDPREQSGIWSTASGVLAAYRSEAALATTRNPSFDGSSFCEENATLYICATGRHQQTLAPLVVGLLGEIRAALYAQFARDTVAGPGVPLSRTPALFALDELANIAPIPDLASLISEGAGQGLVTLACLQDLSQARARWGTEADGLLSLFGTTMVLPGIADIPTLEALSLLAGDEEVPTRSVSTPGGGPSWWARRRATFGRPGASITLHVSTRRRLPSDAIARGAPGTALILDPRAQLGWVGLTPWFTDERWRNPEGPRAPRRDKAVDRRPDLSW
jgi:type IV secretory pathway TraG/TraD family ATPase VirD4